MRRIALLALALACGGQPLPDPTCSTGDEEKAAPLSFGRYGGGYGRSAGELWEALECATGRWRAATCLDADLALMPETWARWLAPELMPNGATGWAGGPFNDARIKVSAGAQPPTVCPVMVHEMGHVLRRDYSHPGPDGSMSFPVTHVFSEPVSRITQEDIDAVCDYWPCGCSHPE